MGHKWAINKTQFHGSFYLQRTLGHITYLLFQGRALASNLHYDARIPEPPGQTADRMSPRGGEGEVEIKTK